MSALSNISNKLQKLRAIPMSIYFNLKYLPLNQAVKLPILVYKTRLVNTQGKIIINAPIKAGMIQLGFPTVPVYPNNGFVWENNGGTCIFNGACYIGNSSSISIGEKGTLTIGAKFAAPSSLKLICFHSIEFKESVVIGWDNLITDSDFHRLTRIDGKLVKAYAPIVIGNNNWFGLRCTILKGSKTPNFCTVGANSTLSKEYDFPEYSLIAGNPVELKKSGVFLDPSNDKIDYPDMN